MVEEEVAQISSFTRKKKNEKLVIKLFLANGKKKFELTSIIQTEKRRD